MRTTARKNSKRDGGVSTTNERLEARVSREQKRLFRRAAALKGVTLTDFMIGSLEEAAAMAVEEREVLKLTLEEKRRFVDALMSPPEPNRALRRAAARYSRMRKRG